jgi:ligand-binding sensor domain-containing protein
MNRKLIILATVGCLLVDTVAEIALGAEALRFAGEGNAAVAETNGLLAGSFTYQLVIGQFYEWNTDPTAVPGILGAMAERTPMKAKVEFKSIGLDDPQILRNPILIMTGNRVFKLGKEEITNLRNYLQQGGFLYADDCGGADWSFRRMIKDILPDNELEPLTPSHPLFKEYYPISEMPKVIDLYGGPAKAFGIAQNGRLVVVYTHDTDLPCAWERYPNGSFVHVVAKDKREAALRFGINVILHALRQDLDATKVAAPATAADNATPPAPPLPASAVTSFPMQRRLPNSHTTAIAANKTHVWFGGFSYLPGDDEGMARYDKATRQWRVFMDAEGILSEEINCLATRDGKVLAGSDTWKWTKGMATFDPANGRWSTLTTEQGLPHNRVIDILDDGDTLWIACRIGLASIARAPTPHAGTTQSDPANPASMNREANVGESLPKPSPTPENGSSQPREELATAVTSPVFPKDGPFMIGLMRSGPFVWANHFAGVARFDKRTSQWAAASRLTPLLPANAIAMAAGKTTAWFLSPVGNQVKLVRFDVETESFSSGSTPGEIDLGKAVSLATDGAELLIGMKDNLGIYAIDSASGTRLQHWAPEGIPADQKLRVARMVYDEGTVWAALWPNGGLWRRKAGEQDWREIPYRAGSPANHILSLARVGGSLYTGTSGVGLWRYDIEQERWFNLNLCLHKNGTLYGYLGDHDAIRWDTIYTVAPDGKRVWMGTNHGLILHDPDRTPSGFEILEPLGNITKAVTLSGGLVWTGGDDGRIRAYDPTANAWKEDLAWTAGGSVRALCLWQNMLWAATAGGLFSRPVGDGSWAPAAGNTELTDLQGLWPTESGLWIASRTALHILRHPTQPATPLAQSKSWMPVRDIHSLSNTLLIATANGLLVCDTNGLARAVCNRDNGLETSDIGAVTASERHLWLGTLGGGLARIDFFLPPMSD